MTGSASPLGAPRQKTAAIEQIEIANRFHDRQTQRILIGSSIVVRMIFSFPRQVLGLSVADFVCKHLHSIVLFVVFPFFRRRRFPDRKIVISIHRPAVLPRYEQKATARCHRAFVAEEKHAKKNWVNLGKENVDNVRRDHKDVSRALGFIAPQCTPVTRMHVFNLIERYINLPTARKKKW